MYKYLQDRGVGVLVIGPSTAEAAAQFSEKHQLPFPVLGDKDRTSYRAYGLRKSLLVIQQSGTLLIDVVGKVGYIYRSTDPKAALDERRLLDEVEKLVGG